jgi:hypothetical protein
VILSKDSINKWINEWLIFTCQINC